MSESAFEAAKAKLVADGAGAAAVESFSRFHKQLADGKLGLLAEGDITPVSDLADSDALTDANSESVLDRTVMIKLNGGLGTGMGMTKAKSLIEAKDGLTFLDIIARQVLGLRERTGAPLPLVLMNSFATRDDTLEALAAYPELETEGIPIDFLQNRVPKLRADDLHPVEWAADPEMEWAPPGHGDLYTAMVTSGMLETLRSKGFRWAFVSNADNLGAVLDERILTWFAGQEIPFLMEVADRTAADRKGGHLARRPDGGLILREIAQTADADLEAFQDTDRHRYFNTNTLWIDLDALATALEAGGGVLDLPMIVNRKTVDPSDSASTEVIQLESAMGAAIALFEGAQAIRVPRSRFAPVKATSDLLGVRSDAYVLTRESHVVLAPERNGIPPVIELDSAHYKLLDDFEAHFPAGAPSLVGCSSLTVKGDVLFGSKITILGDMTVDSGGVGKAAVSDGTLLSSG
jgi:UTP--glucose-1-phosphate uridylyltransferase